MYSGSINKHSKQLRREVRKIADTKGKELGLTRGSVAWGDMVTQIKRELLEKTAEIERKYSYVAPHLRQASCKKDKHTKLYHLKYIQEREKDEVLFILSDSTNLTPQIINWCISHGNKLVSNATEAEIKVQEKISALSAVNCIFQKPFFICESIYFADFYLPDCKAIIEVDGGYHNDPEQIIKDDRRTAYLNSAGIQVHRITNEQVNDSEFLYAFISNIVCSSSEKKAAKPKKAGKKTSVAQEQQAKILRCPDCESLNAEFVDSLSGFPKCKTDWIKSTRLDLLSDIGHVELDLLSDLYSTEITVCNKMPFHVSGQVYFVDMYLPDYKVILDIVGIKGINRAKKEHSQQRISDLKKTGNIVLEIDALKLSNKVYRHILIYFILQLQENIKV